MTRCGSAKAGIGVDKASWRLGEFGSGLDPPGRRPRAGHSCAVPVARPPPPVRVPHVGGVGIGFNSEVSYPASYKAGSATLGHCRLARLLWATPLWAFFALGPRASRRCAARSVGQRKRIWLPRTCKTKSKAGKYRGKSAQALLARAIQNSIGACEAHALALASALALGHTWRPRYSPQTARPALQMPSALLPQSRRQNPPKASRSRKIGRPCKARGRFGGRKLLATVGRTPSMTPLSDMPMAYGLCLPSIDLEDPCSGELSHVSSTRCSRTELTALSISESSPKLHYELTQGLCLESSLLAPCSANWRKPCTAQPGFEGLQLQLRTCTQSQALANFIDRPRGCRGPLSIFHSGIGLFQQEPGHMLGKGFEHELAHTSDSELAKH